MRKLIGAVVVAVMLVGAVPARAGYELQWYNCTSPQEYVAENVMNLIHVAFWLIPRLFVDEDLAPSLDGSFNMEDVSWSIEALALGIGQRTSPIKDLNALFHFGCLHWENVP